MSSIWFTSDLHLSHRNIVEGISQWEDKTECRKFETLEEHDSIILDNINKLVQQDDILYITGDFCLGGRDAIFKNRSRIVCRNVHLIMGNHDIHIRNNSIVPMDKGYVNAQNLFSSCHEILEKKIGGEYMVLCHYAMRTWHKARKGAWNLHGHSHGNLPMYEVGRYIQEAPHRTAGISISPIYAKQYDVGIDTHPEFRPYHLEELRKIMEKRGAFEHHARKQ